MTITYHGHSSFKLKGKRGTVVTDPYDESIGLSLPRISADMVTVSHQHDDHNAIQKITGSARREKPFIVDQPGEYEVGGISIFGVKTFHDASEGTERGQNIVFTILVDGVRVCHLGDLGHELTSDQLDAIGSVDVLFCPVGGKYTIDPEQAVKTIRALEPGIVIPMHYRTERHNSQTFGELKTLNEFCTEYGMQPQPVAKFEVTESSVPEETELVILAEE
ncbi:MBL fold metallo-hydrolase [Candidatus Woesebacteria bacterium]|nr:MBL fold metallo-hydrolase [Candidatus Woesebacteria bacterium]